MGHLAFVEKVKQAKAGIVQLICHECHLNETLNALSALTSLPLAPPMKTSEDYVEFAKSLKETKNYALLIPHFMQKGHGFGIAELWDQQQIVASIKSIVATTNENNIKLISVCVVPNNYEFDYNTVIRAVNPVSEIASFVTTHLAFVSGDDSIVLRDSERKCEISQTLIERARQIAKDNPINVITAKEIKHPKTIVVGNGPAGVNGLLSHQLMGKMDTEVVIASMNAHVESNMVNMHVAKERPTDNGHNTLKVNHEAGTVSMELPNGEDVVLAKPGPYETKRGMMLLCQTPSTKPILTAENYGKWYDLYVLFPDGTVEGLHDLGIDTYDVPNLKIGCPRIDHNYHPELFCKLAGDNDWYVDDVSMEVAAGRWALEHGSAGFNEASYYAFKEGED